MNGSNLARNGGPMPEGKKARIVGFNHVAIEVGDIDAALAFYSRLFEFELRSKSDSMAFIDLGDQFLALQRVAPSPPTMDATLGLSSMTQKRLARHWSTPVARSSPC